MKNYVLLLASSLIMSLFWYSIYAFADHTAAAYLAIIFAIIALAVLCWVAFTIMIVIKVESRQELEKMKKRELTQENMLA